MFLKEFIVYIHDFFKSRDIDLKCMHVFKVLYFNCNDKEIFIPTQNNTHNKYIVYLYIYKIY